MSLEILDLKHRPDHPLCGRIRAHLEASRGTDRLGDNYAAFDPWLDSSVVAFDLVLVDGRPASMGALQSRPSYPKGVFRGNTRHYVFPEFRSKSLRKSRAGESAEGVRFGGVLIRHHLALSRRMGARAFFVSRDRGPRAFSYFMTDRVNAFLPPSDHLKIFADRKFNVCNAPERDSCWHYVAAVSFDGFPIDLILAPMAQRLESPSRLPSPPLWNAGV